MDTKLVAIEEALSIIWEIYENESIVRKDRTSKYISRARVEQELSQKINIQGYSDMISAADIEVKEDRLRFTPEGFQKAKNIIRRQRLAERLLVDILDRPKNEVDSDACEFEHIISPGVEESICILLGHPRECPHGSPIPEGNCCQRAEKSLTSVVVPLDKLKSGESGRVTYLSTRNHPELHRLMNFGIVPGTIIRVHQTYPSLVIQIGQTQVAMENEIAQSIFIYRIG
jgi:DtxR family Mn-dependent transcriptional regulator